MTLTGHHLIAGRDAPCERSPFHAINPSTGKRIDPAFCEADADLANEALLAADGAFDALRTATPETRAQLLETLADEILALGDDLLQRAHEETALPLARLTGERGRTMNQCKMFASLIREGSWAEASIDRAIPDRAPVPKPDIRRVLCHRYRRNGYGVRPGIRVPGRCERSSSSPRHL